MTYTKLIDEMPREIRYNFKVIIDLGSENEVKNLIPFLQKLSGELFSEDINRMWVEDLINIIKKK